MILGLTQNNSVNADKFNKVSSPIQKSEPRNNSNPGQARDSSAMVKRPHPTPPVQKTISQPVAQQDDDIEIVPVVKAEPCDPTQTMMATPILPRTQEQLMDMYDDGSQHMIMANTEQYDDNYSGEFSGPYGDEDYASSLTGGLEASSAGRMMMCEYRS